MIKIFRRSPLVVLFTCLFCLSFFAQDAVYGRGGGGRGGGGGSRGGGASPRVNSGVNLQNRGNISPPGGSSVNRSVNQQNRQDNRSVNQQNRQDNRSVNQQNRQNNQQNRQNNRTETRTNRQDEVTNRQQNRQDFVGDNYNNRWRGGGWYGGGYSVPPGWGWVGFTTGLVIGAVVNSPPPYYSTVYVDSRPYLYSDGVYLESSNDQYVITAPPLGAVVTYLPDGCTAKETNNTLYYDCSGIYYQPFYENGNTVYKVVQF